jgi:hypothetical protein
MAKNPIAIAFGEWTPDQPDRKSGVNEASGVISVGGHYAPFPQVTDYNGADAATATQCLGALNVYDESGAGTVFFGDTTKLYHLPSRVATDISKVGGYTLTGENWWQFAQYGNYVVAVAPGTPPQVYEMGVSALFADLAGSPPLATSVASVSEFLLMGLGATLSWSAFSNITDWTPSTTTQAGTQDFRQEYGYIQAIVGGEYGVIFQERAISRAIYVGPPLIWDFGQDPVETRRGCLGPYAAARWGKHIFFASEDGFYAFDGTQSVSIGDGKVDQYFADRLNYTYREKVIVGVDTFRKLIVFGFPSGSSTRPNELLIYSARDARWTHVAEDLDFLMDLSVAPLTVDNFHNFETSDDLDTVNLDGISIDSNAFNDRRRWLAGFKGTNHRLGTFTGANRQAVVESPEIEIAPGQRGLITEAWPIGEASDANISVSLGYRRALSGAAISYTNASSVNRVGFCPQRLDARFVRARMVIAAGAVWDRMEGVHLKARPSGVR